MQIHPYAWLITVPLTIAMVQVALSPANNFIRKAWLILQQYEAETWFRLRGEYHDPLPPEKSRHFKTVYVAIMILFGGLSVVSFCTCAGLLPDAL